MDRLTHLPDRVNVDRLLRLAGNAEEIAHQELEDQLTLANTVVGGLVAIVNSNEIILLRITRVEGGEFMKGHPMRAPVEDRYGQTERRPWATDEEITISVSRRDALCSVVLDETRCLDQSSLDRMRRLGVEMDREGSLPS